MRILTLPRDLQGEKPHPVRFPLVLRIPSEQATRPGLALPNGQWRRLEDGSIEAVFNSPDELDVCTRATQAIRGRQAGATV